MLIANQHQPLRSKVEAYPDEPDSRGIYIWQRAYTDFNNTHLTQVDARWRFIPGNGLVTQGQGGRVPETTVNYNPHSLSGDQFWTEFNMGAGAFVRNYRDMRNANTIGADKYFHCKANYEAASYGPGGVFFAMHFSNLREIWDQNIKGYPRWDSIRDQEANKWGRDQVGEALNSCKACEKYRPVGLPDKY